MSNYKQLFKELETQIQSSYTEGVTIDEAEKLAGKTLHAQILVSRELQKVSLDGRIRKSGVKAIRAAVYLDIVQKSDKKPTEAQISAMLDSDKIIVAEQEGLDQAEVTVDELERQYSILQNAHIFFRGVARGKFE